METQKNILLRVDKDTYAQIEATAPKGKITEWLVDAVNQKLQSVKSLDAKRVLYKNVTVGDLLAKFDISKAYTISDIAERMDCSYNIASMYFRPCLLKHGYKIVIIGSKR